MSKDNTNTAAETVAALQRQEITHAEITVQAETVARWTNYINGRDVETVHTFKPGDVVRLGSWRPEGMHATTADGFEMFVFWRFLEEMATAPAPQAETVTEGGEKFAKFRATLDALDLATVEQLGGRAHSVKFSGCVRCMISGEAADQLANVCRCSCGAAGGFSGFIYYTETREFFKAHRDEIAARLREQIAEGLFEGARGVVSAVMSFNCLKNCDAAEIEEEAARAFFGPLEGFDDGALDNVANACAWAALEDLAFRLDGQRIEDDETAND